MKKMLIIGMLSLGAVLITGCGAGLGGVGGGGTGGGGTGRYSGTHYLTVRRVLGYVTWSSAENGNPSGANWEKIKNGGCIRDQYVAAAILNAWAAEAYTAKGQTNDAALAAARMCDELRKTDALCSNAPVCRRWRVLYHGAGV